MHDMLTFGHGCYLSKLYAESGLATDQLPGNDELAEMTGAFNQKYATHYTADDIYRILLWARKRGILLTKVRTPKRPDATKPDTMTCP